MNTTNPSAHRPLAMPALREIPQSVEQILAAARRIHPQHSLFVTITPEDDGPVWEFHPYKRWLVLRTQNQGRILEAVACSLLARSNWLGKGAVTTIPVHLHERYRQALDVLVGTLQGALEAREELS